MDMHTTQLLGQDLTSDRSLEAAAGTADIGVAHMRIAAAVPLQTGTTILLLTMRL